MTRMVRDTVFYGLLIVAVVCAALLFVACGSNKRGTGDAPVDQSHIDDTPARIINFPDQFSNVAVKCDRETGSLIYVTTEAVPPVIVEGGCALDAG